MSVRGMQKSTNVNARGPKMLTKKRAPKVGLQDPTSRETAQRMSELIAHRSEQHTFFLRGTSVQTYMSPHIAKDIDESTNMGAKVIRCWLADSARYPVQKATILPDCLGFGATIKRRWLKGSLLNRCLTLCSSRFLIGDPVTRTKGATHTENILNCTKGR